MNLVNVVVLFGLALGACFIASAIDNGFEKITREIRRFRKSPNQSNGYQIILTKEHSVEVIKGLQARQSDWCAGDGALVMQKVIDEIEGQIKAQQ